ncbi:MAG: hypothetical protein ACFFCM_06775 [Promethearchaeota archaeon]
MNLDDYKDFFVNRKRKSSPISGIMGKITRGKKPNDFETLTHDPKRRIVMIMGPDGLEHILGKSGFETLVEIGYTQDHIHHLVDQGFQFKLVIFLPSKSCLLATWENAAKLASEVYPKVKNKIYSKLDGLQRIPFEQIEKDSSLIWGEIEKIGESNLNFITYRRFKQSKGTLIDVRAFFYYTLHFRELFSGDGYIYNQNGEKRSKEYICLNQKLKKFKDYRLVDMEVSL